MSEESADKRFRVIVVGLGVQGEKRRAVAGSQCVATIDPVHPKADFTDVKSVPLPSFDAALVCTPDTEKAEILHYLISNGKHVLVEKPLTPGVEILNTLHHATKQMQTLCYTAYNHRYEPHFVRMHDLLKSGALGRIYTARLFYGNGTAKLVRQSLWRDKGAGVLHDLGSHLLDTVHFWFGQPDAPFLLQSQRCFENKAPDHVSLISDGAVLIQLEASLLSWRNHFTADIFGERGSAHISSLCKWGPTQFLHRTRVLPSGRPEEFTETLEQPDPTWEVEYSAFKEMCAEPAKYDFGNIANDLWIESVFTALSRPSADPAHQKMVKR